MHFLLRCSMSLVFAAPLLNAAPAAVSFSQHQSSVDAYAFVEVEMRVSAPDAANPFTDVTVGADFGHKSSPRLTVDGFCEDRKSTRLNSSHVSISYAVFCLKKKKTKKTI